MEQENGKINAENEEKVMSPEEQKQHSRQMVEDKRGEILSWHEVVKELPDFHNWLDECFINFTGKILVFREKEEEEKTVYRVYFWTFEYRYSLVISFKENGHTYMGGFSQSRKEIPGEFHNRGSDLTDGKYTKETFDKFLNRVLEKEIKPLDAHYL